VECRRGVYIGRRGNGRQKRMSLTPAQDQIELRKKKEDVELCGKNRGPHDYIPIQWSTTGNVKVVTRLFCRVCFCNVAISNLIDNYPEVKI